MTLDQHLTDTNTSNAEFARKISVTANAVGHYRSGRRIPVKPIMNRIIEATGGKVTADSFYAEVKV
ncbi:transcriptional regulator [Micavibrio aeruginosavorus]|uniref:HTH cro/C1-type domain-containing protein n=1 Tax=Micavibrio aeruginosavorus (strain ARL-13) TaxID=856793 RepID=G2KMY1_MICAA|nr:transcriptional regulator [Micavibrio aeruginosavorus]AEP08913.1 putative uncharacterized protein [Micavibrio aeruginosavorus ARL-13]